MLCQLEALVSNEARETEFQVYDLVPFQFYHCGDLKSTVVNSTSDSRVWHSEVNSYMEMISV